MTAKQVHAQLEPATMEALDRIMAHHGLSSRSEAFRMCIKLMDNLIAREKAGYELAVQKPNGAGRTTITVL